MRLTALWPTGQRGGAGAARYVRNASRDERWHAMVPRGVAFLSKRAWCAIKHSVRGRGRPGPGASEPFRTPPDHSDRGRTRSGWGPALCPSKSLSLRRCV